MNNTNPLQEAAKQLALRGRYGDTMMVHMNPIEVDALAQLSPTGQLTTNPHTGQPEAFLPLLFSMIAPSLIGAGTTAGLSSLAASAIGSGLGTMAEGGSLQEGLTAGLMGGVTGGLLKGVMPEGLDLFGKGVEAVPEAAGQAVQNLPQAIPTIDMTQAGPSFMENITGAMGAQTGQLGADVLTQAAPEVAGGFGQKLMGGIESALGPEGLPDTIGSLGAGMVGEMYVPWDTPDALEEESEYQYEGPYMPTEQRRMIGGMDPLQSAFEAEQQMLEGNVFPPGFNMNYGGLVKRLQKGGMASTQGQIENMAAEQRWMSDMNKQRAADSEFNRLQESLGSMAPNMGRRQEIIDRLERDRLANPEAYKDYPYDMTGGEVVVTAPRRKLMEPNR